MLRLLLIFIAIAGSLNGQTNTVTPPAATDSTPDPDTSAINVTEELKTLSKISVAVKVTSVMKADVIKSYVERELRKVGDVKIVEADEFPLMTIILIAHSVETVSGYNSGFALSYAVTTDAYRRIMVYRMVKLQISYPIACRSGVFLRYDGAYLDARLAVCGPDPDDLSKSIEESVADIDTNDIDPLRKLFLKD